MEIHGIRQNLISTNKVSIRSKLNRCTKNVIIDKISLLSALSCEQCLNYLGREKLFDKLDTNKDGTLTEDEALANRNKAKPWGWTRHIDEMPNHIMSKMKYNGLTREEYIRGEGLIDEEGITMLMSC